MLEGGNQRLIWLALAETTVLFRANAGKAWLSGGGPVKRLPDGSVVVPFARPVALGLAKANGDTVEGLSDLIGYTPVTITPEMVGKTVPVFTAIETKESKGGRASADQHGFCEKVRKTGGISGIASNPAMAQLIISEYIERLTQI